MSELARYLWLGGGGVVVLLLAGLKVASLSGRPPVRPVAVSVLPLCPGTPNAVGSTPGEDPRHAVEPFWFSGDPAAALARLQQVVVADGGRLVRADGRYLHFEYRSRFFQFVDDVECLLGVGPGRIDVRSASRSGHSDFGVNRRRIERLRARFREAESG